MGLHACDVSTADGQTLRPSGRCVDKATSHRDGAGMKMTFTLHEVILDESRLGLQDGNLLSRTARMMRGFASRGGLPYLPARAFSLVGKMTTALDIMPGCASGSSRGRVAAALEFQSDAPRPRLHVSIAFVLAPNGGNMR